MSEAKFTKGPWFLNKSRVVNVMSNENNEPVASVCPYNRTPLEVVANTHLIAAAPEMYEMLKAMADATVHNYNYETAKPIYALLAKARGDHD
jgi:hypothetical protein